MKNIIPNKIPNVRYLKNLISQKVVCCNKAAIENNQLKCSDLIHFYFQCVWMTMNNISTSGGLTSETFFLKNHLENVLEKLFSDRFRENQN